MSAHVSGLSRRASAVVANAPLTDFPGLTTDGSTNTGLSRSARASWKRCFVLGTSSMPRIILTLMLVLHRNAPRLTKGDQIAGKEVAGLSRPLTVRAVTRDFSPSGLLHQRVVAHA